MKNARTSYVQATYKPAYKHRTRTGHFRILFSNKASNKDIEQGFEQAPSHKFCMTFPSPMARTPRRGGAEWSTGCSHRREASRR